MVKRMLWGMTAASLLWGAENLEVTADRFTHLEKEQKAIFEGHAHAMQGKSRIDAKKFIVNFDKEGNARVYQAIGHVRFEIVKAPDRHVKGSCDRLIYRVAEDTYRLVGHADVNDLINKRIMKGQEIYLDNKKGLATAKSGHNGPVKFVFPMKDATGKKKGKH
ncbi:lipopolysaccharide transport periplasmic protein LptA [Nitratifractor sp.]|uniref:lipopolysaccharide transport periplasmic protein LptA n=1 Tax=Nitratifractor sp. TaxID=2268144 RepID=UPI0025D4F496|nr:lipopolysaccharide transport periplasmic protein LptA [Nitratifractor sp.]